jgi:hypothetical protein
MFMRRGYFADRQEPILWRELPRCCDGESRSGAADLLVFDKNAMQPFIVELKYDFPTCALTAGILEVLWHWSFNTKHRPGLDLLLHEFGYSSTTKPRAAFAAPESYYDATEKRTRKPRGTEYHTALDWVRYLHEEDIVDVDLFQINDASLNCAPYFEMELRG